MRSLALLAVVLFLPACGQEERAPPRASAAALSGGPQRVVSLDYCADQFVLKLADRAQIAAVSADAGAAYSYMRAAAQGLPRVRPEAEALLALQPDLVVRSYGGGPHLARFLEETGVAVVQLDYARDFEGVRANLRRVADGLGRSQRGAQAIGEMDRRLAAIEPARAGLAGLYVTPAGVTAGQGELIDALFTAAGLENYHRASGWAPLPLERIAQAPPDLVAPVSFGARDDAYDHWSAARHPVVRRLAEGLERAPLDAAWTACAGWYVGEAVEALAAAARR